MLLLTTNHMKVNLSEQEQTDITNKVVESFDNSFEKGNLVDTFSQVGEFALDQAIKSDVLRDVPVIGLLVSGYKTVVNIKDYDFEAHKQLVPMQPGDVPTTYADAMALERDDIPTTYADSTALERNFGLVPKITLREGLRKVCGVV